MHRLSSFFLLLTAGCICQVMAQQSPALSDALRESAAAVQPAAVAPPLPGQLKAEPAPAPARIPDLPAARSETVPATPLNKNPTVSSTSSSGQFVVHGNDLSLRSAFSARSEEISEELRKLLKDQQPWVMPIVVQLNSGEAAKKGGKPASMSAAQITHGGFHLQVTINLRPDLRATDVRAEIIRALLAERILRGQKTLPTQRPLLLPDWFYTGTLQALDYRKRARPSALFAAIFKSGKIFGIEEIIEASPVDMDALSKTIYQTSCCALVLALLDQPEAGTGVSRFLSSLGSDSKPERELLSAAFPGFATSPASLNKWWALQLASLSSPSAAEPLTAADTLKALNEALTIRYQAKPSEIPRPRPVIAKVETPTSASQKSNAKTKVEETEETPAEPAKRSFLSWLNPFGKKPASNDEIIDAAIEEAARKEAQETDSEMPAKPLTVANAESTEASGDEANKVAASSQRQPLFNRWFGEPRKTATGKKTPEEVGEPVPKKKPSILNPLNWFRKTKPANEGKPEVPAKGNETGETPPKPDATAAAVFQDWHTPALLALAYQEAAAEEPAKEKKRFLGIFGGKKKPEEKPSEEPAPSEEKPKEKAKPAKTEPKPENKPEPKPEEKPKAPAQPEQSAEPPKTPAEDAPSAMTAPAEPETAKPKRAPIRIRPLFGSGKKKEEEPKEAEPPMPQPEESTKTEAMAKTETPAPSKSQTEDTPRKTDTEDKPNKKATAESKPQEKAPEPAAEKEKMAEAPKEEPAAKPAEKPIVKAAEKPSPKPKLAPKPAPPKDEPIIAAAISIEDYAAIMKRPDRKEILQHNLVALNALQQRGAILFRPIIADYTAIVGEIINGETKNVEKRLQDLRSRSDQALERSKAVRDVLDLHEANASPAMSGLFEDYLKLPETIEKELPARTDAISKYLDALDREFSKP